MVVLREKNRERYQSTTSEHLTNQCLNRLLSPGSSSACSGAAGEHSFSLLGLQTDYRGGLGLLT